MGSVFGLLSVVCFAIQLPREQASQGFNIRTGHQNTFKKTEEKKAGYRWQVTRDMWQVTQYTWHMANMTFDIIFYLNLLSLNIMNFFILMLLFAQVDRFSVSRRREFKVNEMRVDVSNRFKMNCLILHYFHSYQCWYKITKKYFSKMYC